MAGGSYRRRWWPVVIGVAMVVLPLLWRQFLLWRYRAEIQPRESVQPAPVAVVFGARVYPNGRLSAMLRDRVETAVQLYLNGQVQSIIMSGAGQHSAQNEPEAMMAYALARGVPIEALRADDGGHRTYDTCYRARHEFGVEKAVLVTQAFHLPRALFTCGQLGMQVTGAIADQRYYGRRSMAWSATREVPASLLALLDVIMARPPAVSSAPQPLKLGANASR